MRQSFLKNIARNKYVLLVQVQFLRYLLCPATHFHLNMSVNSEVTSQRKILSGDILTQNHPNFSHMILFTHIFMTKKLNIPPVTSPCLIPILGNKFLLQMHKFNASPFKKLHVKFLLY